TPPESASNVYLILTPAFAEYILTRRGLSYSVTVHTVSNATPIATPCSPTTSFNKYGRSMTPKTAWVAGCHCGQSLAVVARSKTGSGAPVIVIEFVTSPISTPLSAASYYIQV